MDDDKKYTLENENENKNDRDDVFGDFDFTDEFPEEFTADFSTQNKAADEEDDLFSSSFDKPTENDPFADPFTPAAEKNDDLDTASFDKTTPADEFADPFAKQPEHDDYFSESYTKKTQEDPFASFADKEVDEFEDPYAAKAPDTDEFTDPFASKSAHDEFTDPFATQPASDAFSDPFATKEPATDDYFSSFDKGHDDFTSDSFSSKNNEDDFFSQDFTTPRNEDESDPFAPKFNAENDFDDEILRQEPINPEGFDADNENIPPQTPQKKGNILQRFPFIALFVIIVLIFGGYRLMQRGGETNITPAVPGPAKMVEHKTTAPASNLQMDERLAALEQGMINISEQLQIMQGSNVRIEQMEQMVTKIAEEERDVAATLTQLEALSHQVNSLTQLAQQMSALDAEVKMIAGDVDLYTTVSEQTQRAANLSRQALQAKSMVPVPMVVQAAIPGRAWLLSEFGELITVARGDEVPGYGRVLNIDPVAGTVTMSSEAVFREER